MTSQADFRVARERFHRHAQEENQHGAAIPPAQTRTERDEMPEEFPKRRSDRIAMAIPVRVSGTDHSGANFDMDARTVTLSRNGATLIVKQHLKPDQEVKVRFPRRAKEAMFRVVGRIGGESEGYVYGVAQLDPTVDLWGISFPPMADSKRVVGRLVMECSVCHGQEVVYLNELEVQVFQANQSLSRPCGACAKSTLWKNAASDSSSQKPTAATAGDDSSSMPQPSTVGRRRNTRVNAKLMACIRQPGFADEVVMTENVSRGGLCFKSAKAYLSGSPIEVSVPYSSAGSNIFVPARVAHVFEKAGDKIYRIGVAYIKPEEALRHS